MNDEKDTIKHQIYSLAYDEGYSPEEIADELDISLELVYSVIKKNDDEENNETSTLKEIIQQLQQELENIRKTLDNAEIETVQLKKQIQTLQTKGATMAETIETTQGLTKWEYTSSEVRGGLEELNKLGEQGWEVVDGVSFDGGRQKVFKRPKQPKTQQKKDDYYGYGR